MTSPRNNIMPRFKVTLEYDGTPFVGWQVQENGQSVQGRLAEAIKAFSRDEVIPRGAGRTDAGVHALGQVAHFDQQCLGNPPGARRAECAAQARSDQRA
jgi:tRNA pseudouridine38-40 synthase